MIDKVHILVLLDLSCTLQIDLFLILIDHDLNLEADVEDVLLELVIELSL